MRALVDRFETEKAAGLAAARGGSPAEARVHLLRAAECLYRLAQGSTGRLRESRVQNAEKLLAMARKLPASAPASGRAAASDAGEAGGDGAAAWLLPERPPVRFADIAGLADVKEEILVKMVYPFTHPEAAERYKVPRGGGVLLYGPPGTGKTLLARAVAGELDAPFYTVRPSEIMSKWVGEAEQNVQKLFDAARAHPRAVIFIDEVDALLPRRSQDTSSVMRRVVPQILAELEGVRGKGPGALLFVGATNEPWALDPAALRPGRFDRRIHVGLPDPPARREILRIHLSGRPVSQEVSLDSLADGTEGYSGADLRAVVERAANRVFLEAVGGAEQRAIGAADLRESLADVRPSVSRAQLERFRRFETDTRAGREAAPAAAGGGEA
ncbi:MAG: ATP-binding protein [Planctomycetales bacterium]|nr:ATP-binding protein [Planctomycetales bacterium]